MTLPLFPRVSQRHRAPAILAVLTACLSAACVKRLPPAPTPQAVVPRIDAAAPSGNVARLVVDVVEGPTPVQRVHMKPEQIDNGQGRVSFQFVPSPEVLCPVTPCVTDLAPGNVLLGFPVIGDPEAREAELVHVGPEPTVYRRSLSIYANRAGATRVLGIIGASLGGSAVITGTALLPIGLARDNDPLAFAGGISLGAGAALLALGVWAIWHDSPTFRAGSSNHFPLAPSTPGSNP